MREIVADRLYQLLILVAWVIGLTTGLILCRILEVTMSLLRKQKDTRAVDEKKRFVFRYLRENLTEISLILSSIPNVPQEMECKILILQEVLRRALYLEETQENTLESLDNMLVMIHSVEEARRHIRDSERLRPEQRSVRRSVALTMPPGDACCSNDFYEDITTNSQQGTLEEDSTGASSVPSRGG